MRLLIFVAFVLILNACATTPERRLLYYRVKVRSGESLAQISHKFDVSWKQILKDNNLDSPEQIVPGMVLKVKPGPAGYLAGTEGMDRKVSPTKNSQSKSGFWERLFASDDDDDDDENQPQRGLLFGQDSNAYKHIWPVQGKITSPFGYRWFRKHKGIDIGGRIGDKVVASAEGVVSYAGWQKGYGRIIIIRHGEMQSRYAHLNAIAVKANQAVRQGQYIGQVGTSGNASGPHLHFEIRDGRQVPLNPLDFLPKDSLLSSR